MTIAIEYVPIGSLQAAPYNPRKMPDEQMRRLMRGIEEYGVVDPIIVNRTTGNIVGGHQRAEAARRLGLTEVPIVEVALDLEREKALNLALNKISGDWSLELLSGVLGDLDAAGFDMDLTGFSADEIAGLLENGTGGGSSGSGDPDDAPAVDDKGPPTTAPGDLIILGRHRLLCGDSTKAEDLARLMGGTLADMVWTDPPYGVAYVGGVSHDPRYAKKRESSGLRIKDDDLDDVALEAMLGAALGLACDQTKAGGTWYVAAPAGPLHTRFCNVLLGLGIWRQTINWVKSAFVFGRSDYHYRHEPIFYGWKPGAAHYYCGDRTQDTIWEFPRPLGSENPGHPTAKPVGLIERAVLNSSKAGDLVLDPFGGSGSTMIACEQAGRRAYLMELDPRYCDVIVTRWEKFTGKTAQRPAKEAALCPDASPAPSPRESAAPPSSSTPRSSRRSSSSPATA